MRPWLNDADAAVEIGFLIQLRNEIIGKGPQEVSFAELKNAHRPQRPGMILTI